MVTVSMSRGSRVYRFLALLGVVRGDTGNYCDILAEFLALVLSKVLLVAKVVTWLAPLVVVAAWATSMIVTGVWIKPSVFVWCSIEFYVVYMIGVFYYFLYTGKIFGKVIMFKDHPGMKRFMMRIDDNVFYEDYSLNTESMILSKVIWFLTKWTFLFSIVFTFVFFAFLLPVGDTIGWLIAWMVNGVMPGTPFFLGPIVLYCIFGLAMLFWFLYELILTNTYSNSTIMIHMNGFWQAVKNKTCIKIKFED